MIDRAQLAEVIFNTQAAFQREHGIRDGYIDQWHLLAADDFAQKEYRVIADAVLALVGPEIEWCEAHDPAGIPLEHGCPACKVLAINDRLRERIDAQRDEIIADQVEIAHLRERLNANGGLNEGYDPMIGDDILARTTPI